MGYGKELDGCGRCMKITLIVTNVVSFVCGLLLLALGIWVLIDRSFANQLLGTNIFEGAVYVLLLTGAFLIFISFFGCMGAAKEVRCMLLTYYIILFIIFITMLIGGILIYVFREKVQVTMEREMQSSLRYHGNRKEYTDAWDRTQFYLECCGLRSYTDWADEIPDSCCQEAYPGKKLDCQSAQQPNTIFTEGCLTKAVNFFRQTSVILGSVAIITALIMVFQLAFSCALFIKLK